MVEISLYVYQSLLLDLLKNGLWKWEVGTYQHLFLSFLSLIDLPKFPK